MAGNRWIFSKAQLVNTPSQQNGIDTNTELTYRQLTASLIQDIGHTLAVTQLCINTAIVYMHRFYMVHSFTRFPQQEMATACIFLAAKVEEQAQKLKHVIQAANVCLHHEPIDVKSDAFFEQAHNLVINEDILLQTLGFDVRVDHTTTVIAQTCQLIRASKDLAHTSYFLATNCLHLTTFCLQYNPSTIACICILLACQWSNWEIPKSCEGKEWYYYVDKNITLDMLEECIQEFLNIFDKCPSKLKKKIMGQKARGRAHTVQGKELSSEAPPKKRQQLENTPRASTMTNSRYVGKSDGNIGLPIPSGHGEKFDTQPQHNSSTFSPSSGTVNKEQEQHTHPQEPILYNSKSSQEKLIERPLSDNGSLHMASHLATKMQEKKKKSNSMSVKDYLEWKEKEHKQSLKHEHVQPHENRHEHVPSVPNSPKRWKPVPNIPTKLESSHGNTLKTLSNLHKSIQDSVPSAHIKEKAFRQKFDENYNKSALHRSYTNTAVERQMRISQHSKPESQSLKSHSIRQKKMEEISSVKFHPKPIPSPSLYTVKQNSSPPLQVKISTSLKEEHKQSGSKKHPKDQHHSSKSHRRDLHHHIFHSSHVKSADSPASGTKDKPQLHIRMSDRQNQTYQSTSFNDLGTQSSNIKQNHIHESCYEGKYGRNGEKTDKTYNSGNHDSHHQDSEWHSHPWNLRSQAISEISHSPAQNGHRTPSSSEQKPQPSRRRHSPSCHDILDMELSDNGSLEDRISLIISQHSSSDPNHSSDTNSQHFSITPFQQHLIQDNQTENHLKQLIELNRLHIANQMSQQSNVSSGFDLDTYYNSCSPPPLPIDIPPPRPPLPPCSPPPLPTDLPVPRPPLPLSPFSSNSPFDESATWWGRV